MGLLGVDPEKAANLVMGLLGIGDLDTLKQRVGLLGSNPEGFWKRINQDAAKRSAQLSAASDNMLSVMPGVRDAGNQEMLDAAMGLLGITKGDAASILKRTKLGGGSTTNLATMKPVEHGYSVATTKTQRTLPADVTPKEFADFINREGLDKGLLGTWVNDGKIYVDPIENVKSPFAARLNAQRKDQLAAFNLNKMDVEYPSLDPAARIAMRDAAAKNEALAAQQLPTFPNTPEFWPWNDVKHGGYKAAFDEKKGKWFVQKVTDPSEKKLSEAIKKAEADSANFEPVWDLENLRRPTQQNVTLDYAKPAKGYPQWKQDQYGQDFVDLFTELGGKKGNPNEWKFYWTGQLQDDFTKAWGAKKGQEEFQKAMSNVGATTTGARPFQNVRMGSYQDVLQNQGLPIPAQVPYPYGHNMWATHRDALQSLRDNGGVYMDPKKNPKGATFSGNLSGQTTAPTMDQVMSAGAELTDQAGKPILAPHDNAYDLPVQAFDKVVGNLKKNKNIPPEVRKGLLASDVQSKDWYELGGGIEYGLPILKHYSDRINVTARVTGLPPQTVKELWIQKKMPLLSVGGLGLLGGGLSQIDSEAQQ